MTARLALLTGATGFLGGHVARALVAQGWRVRALARSDPGARAAAGGPPDRNGRGETCRAVRISRPRRRAATRSCTWPASSRRAHSRNTGRSTLRGTERLLAAAAAVAPDAMFVQISSLAAAGPARDGRPVTPSDPPRPVSWYGQSKLEGEEAVRRGWKGPWIVVRPGVIYGPADQGLLTYFRMAARGFVPVPAARSRIQIGSVEQIALAIAKAAGRRDLAGRTAFLCDPEPVTVGQLAGLIARLPAEARPAHPASGFSRAGGGPRRDDPGDPDEGVAPLQCGQGQGTACRAMALRVRPSGRARAARPDSPGKGASRHLGLVSVSGAG